MKRTALLLGILLVPFGQPSSAAAQNPQDILVVVNQQAEVAETTPQELKNIFLKKKSFWRAGSQVIPIHAREGSPLRDAFRQQLLAMTSTEEQEYWKNSKIKKGLTEPTSFSNTQKAVYKLRSAVSYVFRADFKEGVAKVVYVLPAR